MLFPDDTVSQRSHSSHSTSGCSSMAPQGNHGNREPSRDPAKRRRESGENSIGTQTPPPQPEAKRPRCKLRKYRKGTGTWKIEQCGFTKEYCVQKM